LGIFYEADLVGRCSINVAESRDKGYAETLSGHRRHYPDHNSSYIILESA
jgi:DNA polymerase I-like protein with 3'-5' exonuclease and polymerase domains